MTGSSCFNLGETENVGLTSGDSNEQRQLFMVHCSGGFEVDGLAVVGNLNSLSLQKLKVGQSVPVIEINCSTRDN